MNNYYKYILFDWDGCLAKTLNIWLKSYKEIFAKYNLYPTDYEISNKAFGNPEGPKKLGITNINEFNEKLISLTNSRLQKVELNDGAYSLLLNLKRNDLKLGLVTTSPRELIKKPLKENRLDNIFDIILTAEDVVHHKPDPEIINLAINRLNAGREKTIIVGDSKSDLGAAMNAKIDSILYYPRQNEIFYNLENLKQYKPTYVISNFEESIKIINRQK